MNNRHRQMSGCPNCSPQQPGAIVTVHYLPPWSELLELRARIGTALAVLNHRGCTAETARLAGRVLSGEPLAKLAAEEQGIAG